MYTKPIYEYAGAGLNEQFYNVLEDGYEEKLLQKLNSCANPRRVFAALSSLIGKPDIKDIRKA